MSVKLVKHENDKAVFTAEITAEAFEKEVQKAYLKNRGQIQIPGFRKGKAPRKLIESSYGKDIFYDDALNACIPHVYEAAVEELGLDPIDQPSADIKEEIDPKKAIEIEFTVETRPVPVLGDYSVIELEEKTFLSADERVEDELSKAQEANARVVVVEDRPAQEGDIVVIDFEGFKDGEAFEGGKGEGHELELGSGQFIPGFEEGLIGSNTGDDKDLELTFPEDYGAEDLAGQAVVFKVKVNAIKEKQLPELDDDFAMDISEFDTIEEYRNSLREDKAKEVEEQQKIDTENRAIEKLIEISQVGAPDVLVNGYIDDEMHRMEHQLKDMGMDMETYISYFAGGDEAMVRNQFRERSTMRVKADLVIDALVEAEKIEATDEELTSDLKELAEAYKVEDVEDFIEKMKQTPDSQYIQQNIKRRKAVELLLSKVQFVEAQADVDEETQA